MYDTSTTPSSESHDGLLFRWLVFYTLISVCVWLGINSVVMAWHMLAYQIVPLLQHGPPIDPVFVGDVGVFPMKHVLDWLAKHDWYAVRKFAEGVKSSSVFLGVVVFPVLAMLTFIGIINQHENITTQKIRRQPLTDERLSNFEKRFKAQYGCAKQWSNSYRPLPEELRKWLGYELDRNAHTQAVRDNAYERLLARLTENDTDAVKS